MSLFKCKMCGGDLEIADGARVAVCQYCGTTQTIPKLDSSKAENLYDRAGHFRRSNEFDKAEAIYERLLEEDKTDSECYWSLVLCRYGVEYVEDPTTHKRIPTVNRTQYTSVFDDDNYKLAIKYASPEQKAVYEAEAEQLNEIQKGILAISQKEEPFDVFICYKETDSQGRRTQDSVLANDLYHQLKQEGFRVFFSRITLEDKLGTAYEPYIFAALNSAKVMIVMGTKPEYFDAVWVKNEWSRYLALIKKDNRKMLIPAYRDMDPYDLPEEFSHLQAQDMSRLGFMQDLIRGIKKIIKPASETATKVVQVNSAQAVPLLKRAFIFLEDGEWENADNYAEQVLNLDPECSEAYLVKLMCTLKIKRREELAQVERPFDDMNEYGKIMRFGNDVLRAEVDGYIHEVKYGAAQKVLENAKGKKDFSAAAKMFADIPGYKDADLMHEKCILSIENCDKDSKYNRAIGFCKNPSDDPELHLKEAKKIFTELSGWRKADEYAELCDKKLEELAQKEEQRKAAEAKALEKEKKMKKIWTAVFAGVVTAIVLILAGGLIYKNYYLPLKTYKEAVELMDSGELLRARIKFMTISDFKDSRELADESLYRIAEQLIEQGDTASAMERMEQLGDYKNAYEYRYKYAMDLAAEGNTDGAIEQLQKISSYKDAAEQIKAIRYQQGLQHMKAKEYSAAKTIFESLGDYQDSAAKVQEVVDLDKKRQNWIYKKYIENFDFYDVSEDDIIKQGKALDTVTDDEIWSKIGDSISKFSDMGYVIVLTNKAQSLADYVKSEYAGTIDGMYYCDNIERAGSYYSYSQSFLLSEILLQKKHYTWMGTADVSLPTETADNIYSHGSKAIICKYTKADESGWTNYRYEGYEVKARIENKEIVYDVTKYVDGAGTTRSGLSIYELLNY